MATKRNTPKLFLFLLKIPVPWVFVLSYLIGVGLEFLFQFLALSPEIINICKITGVVLFVIGAVIAALSLWIFYKSKTTTVPGQASVALVNWGPYRFTRNPMYVSLILVYFGEAAMLTQLWPLLVLPFTFYYVNWVVIPIEEAKLKEVFGEKYLQYCSKVRRWI